MQAGKLIEPGIYLNSLDHKLDNRVHRIISRWSWENKNISIHVSVRALVINKHRALLLMPRVFKFWIMGVSPERRDSSLLVTQQTHIIDMYHSLDRVDNGQNLLELIPRREGHTCPIPHDRPNLVLTFSQLTSMRGPGLGARGVIGVPGGLESNPSPSSASVSSR